MFIRVDYLAFTCYDFGYCVFNSSWGFYDKFHRYLETEYF